MDQAMPNLVSADSNSISAPSNPLLVSRAKACEMLGISVSHLRRLIKAGELKPIFLNASAQPRRNGKLYFRTSAIEALVEKYEKRAAP
jgi:predicted site-specific integrase-resolvase